MNTSSSVKLEHFDAKFLHDLENFALPQEQIQFSALPKEIINTTDRQYRIVIAHDELAVGFFLLHTSDRVKDYSGNPNALLLTALTVDHKHQGRGFAKKGMLALPHFIKDSFPNYNEVVLVVNEKNIPAQHLYKTVGFIDTGIRKTGPIGEQILMSLLIK